MTEDEQYRAHLLTSLKTQIRTCEMLLDYAKTDALATESVEIYKTLVQALELVRSVSGANFKP